MTDLLTSVVFRDIMSQFLLIIIYQNNTTLTRCTIFVLAYLPTRQKYFFKLTRQFYVQSNLVDCYSGKLDLLLFFVVFSDVW